MEKYSTNFEMRGGYIFDRDAIVSIAQKLSNFTQNQVSVAVSLADNHNVQSSDVEGVLADSYVTNRIIERLNLSSVGRSAFADPSGQTSGRYADVTFSSRRDHVVDVSIRGDRDACVALRGELETIIDGRRQWYHFFWMRIPVIVDLLLFLGVASFLSITSLMLVSHFIGADAAKASAWVAFPIAGLEMLILFWLRKKMFPRLVLLVGKSGDTASFARSIRQTVFFAIALAVCVSVFSSYLYDRIK